MKHMKKRITLTEEQAQTTYKNITSLYVLLKTIDGIDKVYLKKLRFWDSAMNNHLRRAQNSVEYLIKEFERNFKPIDADRMEYDAPAELYTVLERLSEMHPDKIKQILDDIESTHEGEQI